MIHELKSDKLTVKISERGAELKSVSSESEEYMWSGNPMYWEDVAPVLFPVCGRLLDSRYTFDGKEYKINKHGYVDLNCSFIGEILSQLANEDRILYCSSEERSMKLMGSISRILM